MPVLAFDLRNKVKDAEYVIDSRTGKPSKESYLRLSPYNRKNIEIIKSIYNDLSSMPNLMAFYSTMTRS